MTNKEIKKEVREIFEEMSLEENAAYKIGDCFESRLSVYGLENLKTERSGVIIDEMRRDLTNVFNPDRNV